MAILRVCCCCYSVRRGSYASAVYTIIYFFLFALLTTNYLYHEIYKADELQSLDGASASLTSPTGTPESINNATNNSTSGVTSTIINSTFHTHSPNSQKSAGDLVIIMVDLTSELCGFAASFLLICGLQQEKKAYLIPWLILVPFHTAIDIISFLNIIIDDVAQAEQENQDLEWWAFVIGLFVLLDLTFNLINVYLFLCVFSQYQEYAAGRGTAAYEALNSTLTVHYHSESGGHGQGVVVTKNSIPKASNHSNERHVNLDKNGTGNPCFNDIEKFDIWCEDLVLDKLDAAADRAKGNGQLLPKMLNNGQNKEKTRSGSSPSVRFFESDTKSLCADNTSQHNFDNGGKSKKKTFGGRLAPIGSRKHSSGNGYDDFGGDSKLGTSKKLSPPSGRSAEELSDTTTFGTIDFPSET